MQIEEEDNEGDKESLKVVIERKVGTKLKMMKIERRQKIRTYFIKGFIPSMKMQC